MTRCFAVIVCGLRPFTIVSLIIYSLCAGITNQVLESKNYGYYSGAVKRETNGGNHNTNLNLESLNELEALVFLTNGLILTEAVLTKQVGIGSMVTDLMIVSQMSDYEGWIDVLEKNLDDVTTQKLEQLNKELKTLQDKIENGESTSIPIDLIPVISSIIYDIGSIDVIVEAAESFKSTLEAYEKNPILLDLQNHETDLRLLLEWPVAVESITNLNLSNAALDVIALAIQAPFTSANIKTSVLLQEAFDECKAYDPSIQDESVNTAHRTNCVKKLYDSVKQLPWDKVGKPSLVYSVNLIKLVEVVYFGKLKNLNNVKETIADVSTTLKKAWDNQKNSINFSTSIKNSKTVFQTMNTLKSSTKLTSLTDALKLLEPMCAIVEEMQNSFNKSASGFSKQSFVSKFRSYEGFFNGFYSMKYFADYTVSSHLVPSKFLSSGINERSQILKTWATQLSPVIESLHGLESIKYLLDVQKQLTDAIKNLITSSDARLDAIEHSMKELPDLNGIPETLDEIVKLIDFSIENKWEEKSAKINELTFVVDQLKQLNQLLVPFLEFYDFGSNLNEKLKKVATPNQKIDKISDELYPEVVAFLNTIEDGIQHAKNLEDSTKGLNQRAISKTVQGNINVLKQIAVEPTTPYDHSLSLTVEKVMDVSTKMNEAVLKLDTLIMKKQDVETFVTDFSKFRSLKTLSDNQPEKNVTKAAENLLTAIANPPKLKTDMKPSEAIGKLMGGTPFGTDILNDFLPLCKKNRFLMDNMKSSEILAKMAGTIESQKGITKLGEIMQEVVSCEVLYHRTTNVLETFGRVEKFNQGFEQCQGFMVTLDKKGRTNALTQLIAAEKIEKDNEKKGLQFDDGVEKMRVLAENLDPKNSPQFDQFKKGLKKVIDALSYVNCSKEPTHINCRVNESSSKSKPTGAPSSPTLLIIIIVVLVVAVLLAVGLVFWCRRKNKDITNEYDNLFESLTSGLLTGEYTPSYMKDNTTHILGFSLPGKGLTKFRASWNVQFMQCHNPETQGMHRNILGDTFRSYTIPLFDNRWKVSLPMCDDEKAFIHASKLPMVDDRRWIASMAPLPNDAGNSLFFDMLWNENTAIIVQVCLDKEEGQQPINYATCSRAGRYTITRKEISNVDGVIRSELTLAQPINDKREERTLIHLQHTKWPVGSVPDDIGPVIKMFDDVEVVIRKSEQSSVVVHGMLGNGRTMTFAIMAHLFDAQRSALSKTGAVITETINEMRYSRHGAIQSINQFAFLELAITKYASMKQTDEKLKKDEMEKFTTLNRMLLKNKAHVKKGGKQAGKSGNPATKLPVELSTRSDSSNPISTNTSVSEGKPSPLPQDIQTKKS